MVPKIFSMLDKSAAKGAGKPSAQEQGSNAPAPNERGENNGRPERKQQGGKPKRPLKTFKPRQPREGGESQNNGQAKQNNN